MLQKKIVVVINVKKRGITQKKQFPVLVDKYMSGIGAHTQKICTASAFY